MSVQAQQREQKISAKALAMLFHEYFVAAGTAATESAGGVPNQQAWDDLSPETQAHFIAAFDRLQGLFLGFGDPARLQVSNIVSHTTHEGMVQFTFGNAGGQMSQDDARMIAYEFMDAAEAAESETVAFRMFKGFDSAENEVQAVKFIAVMRDEREKLRVERIERRLHGKGH